VAPTDATITDWVDVCMTTGASGCYGQFVDNNTYSAPGANWWTKFYGGTYVFPAVDPNGCKTAPQYPLTQTISAHSWHIAGTVGDYSGFGLWFSPCMIDMSQYTGGISFTVSGTTGTSTTISVTVGTSSNTAHDPTNCNSNVGTCTAASCKAGTATFTVTTTATTVTLPWSQFTGGAPSATVNPAEIIGVNFNLPDPYVYTTTPPVATPYAADVTIGDIKLIP
jgi:hypothetical protein